MTADIHDLKLVKRHPEVGDHFAELLAKMSPDRFAKELEQRRQSASCFGRREAQALFAVARIEGRFSVYAAHGTDAEKELAQRVLEIIAQEKAYFDALDAEHHQ